MHDGYRPARSPDSAACAAFLMRFARSWVIPPPSEPPRNPTWRNGAPLTEPMALAPGDALSIGPVKAQCSVSF